MIGTHELLMILVVAAVLAAIEGKGELELFLVRFLGWLLGRAGEDQRLPKE